MAGSQASGAQQAEALESEKLEASPNQESARVVEENGSAEKSTESKSRKEDSAANEPNAMAIIPDSQLDDKKPSAPEGQSPSRGGDTAETREVDGQDSLGTNSSVAQDEGSMDVDSTPPAVPQPVAAADSLSQAPISKQQWLLPPITPRFQGKKCLVLDLDETLVHSSFKVSHSIMLK